MEQRSKIEEMVPKIACRKVSGRVRTSTFGLFTTPVLMYSKTVFVVQFTIFSFFFSSLQYFHFLKRFLVVQNFRKALKIGFISFNLSSQKP